MNKIYIWRSYISNDEETMSDKIFDMLCEDCKDISVVEAEVESEWENNVEEEQTNVKDVFDLMKAGYIFLEHCGVDND